MRRHRWIIKDLEQQLGAGKPSNRELRLAKAKQALADEEIEVRHELTEAFQNLTCRYQTMESSYGRWQAAEARVSEYGSGYRAAVPKDQRSVLISAWLQARADAATAESAFFTSVIEYQKAIIDLNARKGSLLDYNGVRLAEAGG